MLSFEQVPTSGVDELETVSVAAFSPDGRFLATGGEDGVVRLWDAAGEQLIQTFDIKADDGPDARVLAVALGGGWRPVLAAGTDTGRVLTWSATDGQRLNAILAEERHLSAIAISPDGGLLAAGIGDTVRVWDPTTGQPVRRLTGHTDRVTQVAFDTHGGRLASAGLDGLRLWNSATGRLLHTFVGAAGSLTAVALDHGGNRLAGTGPTAATVRIWNSHTGRELAAIDCGGDAPRSIAFSPDGRLLALGGPSRSLRVWDAVTGAEVCSLTGRRMGVVSGVTFSPNGTELVTVNGLRKGPLPRGTLNQPFARWRFRESEPAPAAVETIPTITAHRTLRHDHFVYSVGYSPAGTRLVTKDREVRVWHRDDGQLVRTIGPANSLADAPWSPDGAYLAHVRDLTIIVITDPETGREVRTWDGRHLGVSSLAFSPDGRQLAGSLGDHSIVFLDPSTGRELRRLTVPRSAVHGGSTAMAFSPDGRRLAKCAGDATCAVDLWDLDVEEPGRLYGHTDYVDSIAFDPSGARVASGGLDRSVVLWDVDTGDEIIELTEHSGAVRAVAYSPDGVWLASGDSNGMILLRDPATGSLTHRLTGHTGSILSIAFSPDSTQLASASVDATVRLWDLPPNH